jgi:ABC-type dipeptide/oligopeptide/nickel transport system ATPase component
VGHAGCHGGRCDLLSARLLANEVMVLNEGVMVERGPTLQVIGGTKDPYTRKLLAAIPRPGASGTPDIPRGDTEMRAESA